MATQTMVNPQTGAIYDIPSEMVPKAIKDGLEPGVEMVRGKESFIIPKSQEEVSLKHGLVYPEVPNPSAMPGQFKKGLVEGAVDSVTSGGPNDIRNLANSVSGGMAGAANIPMHGMMDLGAYGQWGPTMIGSQKAYGPLVEQGLNAVRAAKSTGPAIAAGASAGGNMIQKIVAALVKRPARALLGGAIGNEALGDPIGLRNRIRRYLNDDSTAPTE